MDQQTLDLLQQMPSGMWTCAIVGLFILWAAFWAVFCIIFQRNLGAVPEPHRQTGAGQIWLLVIFPFSIVWMFFVLPRLSDSWRSWFDARGDGPGGKYGRSAGLWCAWLGLVSNLLGLQPFVGGGATVTMIAQLLSLLTGLAGFIFLIAFCIILNDLKLKSAAPQSTKQG